VPTHVEIHEEGPLEGFQIEPGPISTADKIKLIEALAETGLHHIQAASFVSPRIVPGWADAEDVVAGFTRRRASTIPGCGSMRNGLNRALVFRNKADDVRLDRLDCVGSVYAEEPAPQHAENIEAMKKRTALISKTMSRCRGSE